jgi:hypothetical protein
VVNAVGQMALPCKSQKRTSAAKAVERQRMCGKSRTPTQDCVLG